MNREDRSTPQDGSVFIPNPSQQKALRELREARLSARSDGEDAWQFAVEIDEFYRLGLNRVDLRSLLQWGYVEHAQERTKPSSSRRIFQRLDGLALPKRTCFAITPKGFEAASATTSKGGKKDAVLAIGPRWDKAARQLWWQGYLVKEFHNPAPNQEWVLEAFEEVGWPARMDDPLPHAQGIDPKVRLHDTIKALNRHHKHRILRFGGNGSGQGIRWFLVRRG